jgi:predicted DNA-binding protein
MFMPSINVYVRDSDAPLFERLKTILEREGKSMSEFIAEAAGKYVNYRNSEPEDIGLEADGVKRIFKGHRLYWEEDSNGAQCGVFLTAKRAIAYWVLDIDGPKFEVYDDLEELFETQDWLEERDHRTVKSEIQKEYAALTKETIVERLDI